MKATQARALPGTAIVVRNSGSADGMGGFLDSWAAVGTVAARLAPSDRTPAERIAGEEVASILDWDITVPIGTDVTVKDRITIAGRTFEIQGVNDDEGFGSALRITAVSHNDELRS